MRYADLSYELTIRDGFVIVHRCVETKLGFADRLRGRRAFRRDQVGVYRLSSGWHMDLNRTLNNGSELVVSLRATA